MQRNVFSLRKSNVRFFPVLCTRFPFLLERHFLTLPADFRISSNENTFAKISHKSRSKRIFTFCIHLSLISLRLDLREFSAIKTNCLDAESNCIYPRFIMRRKDVLNIFLWHKNAEGKACRIRDAIFFFHAAERCGECTRTERFYFQEGWFGIFCFCRRINLWTKRKH